MTLFFRIRNLFSSTASKIWIMANKKIPKNINSETMVKPQPKGLRFERRFTKEGVSPFELFEYDYRTSIIRNPTGEIVFEMNNVEVPKQWSQIATDILAQKYFRKAGVPQPD